VVTVPDPLLLRKSGSAGNITRTFGSVARNAGGHSMNQIAIQIPRLITNIGQYLEIISVFLLLVLPNSFIITVSLQAILCSGVDIKVSNKPRRSGAAVVGLLKHVFPHRKQGTNEIWPFGIIP
jgi:hypothetical protein